MTFQDIHIRDPFILEDDGKYILYGSRGRELWGKCTGLDAWVSEDLENWSDPHEVFTPPVDFWSDQHFWAPEVHKYQGRYYMLVSFSSETRNRGTQILAADSPLGPFLPHSDGPVTPAAWPCLDGTLIVENGVPYMVFCHEWVHAVDGEMCALRLSEDLTHPIGEPILLFRASEPVWGKPYPRENTYVTDGPFLYRTVDGGLLMIWSSFAEQGYCEAIAYSESGSVLGPWRHDERLLFEKDGGHGMLFRDKSGQLQFVCHQPNNSPMERPVLIPLEETDGTLRRK